MSENQHKLSLAVIRAVGKKQEIDDELKLLLLLFADTSIPLDVRWRYYVELEKAGLLQTESYGDGHIDALEDDLNLYDDFYTERHSTLSYREMYDMRDHPKRKNFKWDAWREKVLSEEVSKGYGSFTYDW